MLIVGPKKYIASNFISEAELEQVVQENAEYIFGPDSFYLPKSLIKTPDGFGTIPDGFVVDLAARTWFIVEAELAIHSVWNHIAPQVAKQIIAASQPSSRRLLTEMVIDRVRGNTQFKLRFEEAGIVDLDIRRVLSEIFEKNPIVGIPIDAVGKDLTEWARTLRVEVKLWLVRKMVEFGNESNVIYEIPEEYRPTLDTSANTAEAVASLTPTDITMEDLLTAELLYAGQKLSFVYGLKGGEKTRYEATVLPSGSIEALNRTFSAPSYAALLCMHESGSDRLTVNCWTSWRDASGRTLADLRSILSSRQIATQ